MFLFIIIFVSAFVGICFVNANYEGEDKSYGPCEPSECDDDDDLFKYDPDFDLTDPYNSPTNIYHHQHHHHGMRDDDD